MRMVNLLYEAKTDPSSQIKAHPIPTVNLLLNLRHRIQKIFSTDVSDQHVVCTHHPGALFSRIHNYNHHCAFNTIVVRVLEFVMVRLHFLGNVHEHQTIGTVMKNKSLTNKYRQFSSLLLRPQITLSYNYSRLDSSTMYYLDFKQKTSAISTKASTARQCTASARN